MSDLREALMKWFEELEERKRALGIPSACLKDARNPGDRRTEEKKILLRRRAERLRAAGKPDLFPALNIDD